MTAKNYKKAIAVLTALNYVSALRISVRSTSKVKSFVRWIYNISLLFVSMSVITYFELTVANEKLYKKINFLYLYLDVTFIVLNVWLVMLGWYHSKNLLTFREKISKVDKDLQKLGSKFNYQHLFVRILIVGSIWLVTSIVLHGYYANSTIRPQAGNYFIFVVISYFYTNNIGSIILFDFNIRVSCLGLRFKQTNELFDSIFVKDRRIEEDINSISKQNIEYFSSYLETFPKNRPFNSKCESRPSKAILQQIRFVHQQLCCASKMCNKVFDTQLLLDSSLLVVQLAFSIYFTYMKLYLPTGSYQLPSDLLLVIVLDGIINCVKLFFTCYNCEYTMKQAKKMIRAMHEFSLYQTDTELKEEILQFILQLSHTFLREKGTIFRLNFSYLRECFSFVLRYLVLVIQFNMSIYSNDTPEPLNSTIH